MYYIYHLKGKKIGCTINPKYRTKRQGFTDYEILEEHTDIHIASEREIELQKQYGYKVDKIPYYTIIKAPTIKGCIAGGKTQGRISVENGHMERMRSFEASSKGGKIGGKRNAESGQLERIRKVRWLPVIQMNKLGTIIKEFVSVKSAANYLNLHPNGISRCCKGTLKTTGGYKFKYKNN